MSHELQAQSDPLAVAEHVAQAFKSQPELFDPAAFSAEELETVRAARSLSRYNGARTRSEARVATVVALRQQGCSLREIERRTGMDTRLVSIVIREAERAQIVPALKEMVTRRLAETTERALDRLDQELGHGTPDAQLVRALGVVAGIGADKIAAASTPAGDLHLHQHVHLAGVDPAREYLKARAEALATESDSVGSGVVSSVSGGFSASAADLAASAVRSEAAPIDVQAETVSHSDQLNQSEAEVRDGAGGVRPAAGPGPSGDGMD